MSAPAPLFVATTGIRFDRRPRWPAAAALLMLCAGGLAWRAHVATIEPALPMASAWGAWPSGVAAAPVGRAPVQPAAGASAAALGAGPEPAPTARSLGLSAQVDRLRSTTSAVDAYAAYGIVHACSRARRLEAQGFAQRPRAAITCGDLAPAQMLAEPALLHQAAAAGVAGAVWSFLAAGPDGASGKMPMGTRAEMADPATADYFARARAYQDAAARAGDRLAWMSLSYRALSEDGDPAQSLAYWVAQELVARGQGRAPSPAHAAVVERLGAELTSPQATAAATTGWQLAAQALASCLGCRDATDTASRQIAFGEAIRAQEAAAAPEQLQPLPYAPDRHRAASYSANDTVTLCIGPRCETARYQATGVWWPEPKPSP